MNLKINAMIYFRFYEERRIEINLPFGRIDADHDIFRECFSGEHFENFQKNLSKITYLAQKRFGTGFFWACSRTYESDTPDVSLCKDARFRPVVHRIPSRSPSKRCDERVKIARNTLEGSAIFPLPFLPGEIGRKRIKFGFLGFWIWPGEHVIPSLRTVKTVTPCWLGARPNAHNPRQRGLNPKRKSQGSMLIWMIDEARTKRILCLAW